MAGNKILIKNRWELIMKAIYRLRHNFLFRENGESVYPHSSGKRLDWVDLVCKFSGLGEVLF